MKFKKIAAASLAASMILSSTVYASELYSVYDLTRETRLGTGITYEKIEKYTSKGWMNINIVRADLTDKYTKIDPITSEDGVSNRAYLSSMIKSSGAVAGVNGDFFYMADPTYTYGAVIKGGNIITSPLPYDSGYPTVSRLLDGKIDISLWNPKITLHGTDGTEFDVVVLNKTSSLDWSLSILTDDWGEKSPGYSGDKDIIEIVVENNIVKQVRKNKDSIEIPENGYVIASCNAEMINKLSDSFIIGKKAALDIELDFQPDELDWSFGALNYLVKDGQINDISDEVLYSHPRTAIGFNEDNTEMIFVTIDGRNQEYVGVTQTELAQIMTGLGAYNVINMDGGGSTTMGVDFLRNSNVTVVNLPSEGRERAIASGVGIFNTSPESSDVETVEVAPASTKVFNKTELPLDINLYNEYSTPIDFDMSDVEFKVSPASAGTFDGNVFKPSNAGKATITAYAGDARGSIEIEILGKPVALKFGTDSITLDSKEQYEIGSITGIDKNGNSAPIPPKYISYSYRNRVGKITDGIFTAGSINTTGAITASFGDAVANIQVKVGYRYTTLNRFENLNGLKLTLYPEKSDGNMEISDDYVKEGRKSLKLDYDFTKMTDQSIAFVNFGDEKEGLTLEGKPEAIGMWVYGDGKEHWLRCRIKDAYGTESKLTFADKVDWKGWKWVTADIPAGISYPVKLNNIYLAEINESRKDSGTIYIDNLRLMYEPNDKNLGLRAETKFIDPMDVSSVLNFDEKLIITTDGKESVSPDGKIICFDGIVTNGSMSASDAVMWNNIKSFADYEDKVLVLSMNKSIYSISDVREIEILKSILKKASEKNDVFVVWKGKAESTFMEDGIRYVTYDDSFEIGTDGIVSYKN